MTAEAKRTYGGYKMFRTFRVALVAGSAAAALTATQAQAQDAAAIYYDYYMAISAYNMCSDQAKDRDLTLAQYNALDDYIMTQLPTDLGAGLKLTIIEDAHIKTNQMWAGKGCSGDVRAAFDRFATQLAPVIGVTARVQTTPG